MATLLPSAVISATRLASSTARDCSPYGIADGEAKHHCEQQLDHGLRHTFAGGLYNNTRGQFPCRTNMAPLRVPVTIPATGVPLAGFIGKIHVTESNPVPPIRVEIGGLTWRGLDPATLTDKRSNRPRRARAHLDWLVTNASFWCRGIYFASQIKSFPRATHVVIEMALPQGTNARRPLRRRGEQSSKKGRCSLTALPGKIYWRMKCPSPR